MNNGHPVKLNATIHRCTNWAQVEYVAGLGLHFYSLPLKLKGERLWVLSSPRDYLYGHLDDFANMIIASQDERKRRYLEDHGPKDMPEDIAMMVARNGNAILAIRRNGEILVNERAKSGEPGYARAIARLLPAYQSALVARPNLFNN